MALKYVNAIEGELNGACTNPKCKEELMRAISAAVPKASVWKVASILLLPTIIGFAVVYSVITTADTKYAREVEVKVLAAQLGFMTSSLKDLKDSIGNLDRDLTFKLEEIQKRQIEVYKSLGSQREKNEKSSNNNYGPRSGEASK